jgi:hypothetical protein
MEATLRTVVIDAPHAANRQPGGFRPCSTWDLERRGRQAMVVLATVSVRTAGEWKKPGTRKAVPAS